jgi:hypothetical protein
MAGLGVADKAINVEETPFEAICDALISGANA